MKFEGARIFPLKVEMTDSLGSIIELAALWPSHKNHPELVKVRPPSTFNICPVMCDALCTDC